MSLRDRILATQDIPSEVIHVPQWDMKLEVRGLDGKARAQMISGHMNSETGLIDAETLYPQLVINCVFDPETAEQVFEEGDAVAINSKSGAALELLAQTAIRLSGMSATAIEEAGKESLPNQKNATTTT